MLDIAELRHCLLQSLDNYQRCGLKRIPRASADTLPPDVLAALAEVRSGTHRQSTATSPVALAANTSSQPVASAQSTTQAAPAARHEPNAAPVVTPTHSPETQLLPDRPWGIPSLDDDDRRSRLAILNEEIKACRLCNDIVCYRQQTVFGTGPIRPTVCFMGEAPGADEDKLGTPFVGRAGQLLTKIIEAMQLKRDEVFILNALKCRPPQNRTPVPDEIENCKPFVEAQLDVLQPKYIVCLGAVAVRSLLGLTLPVGSLRGRFHQYRQARVIVTYHPSYLLRNESAKKLVWQDMQMLMHELGLKPPSKK